MRYITSIIIIAIFFSTFTSVKADEDEKKPDQKHIETYNEDVTGDSHKETISLYGTPLAGDSDYYKDIWAIIEFPDQSEQKISYEGGYRPELTYVDMNQNNINDILFSVKSSQQEDTSQYQLNSVENHDVTDISLPTQDHVHGFFKDQFVVELQISPTEEKEVINVENRAEKYVEENIYNDKGKVVETTSVQPQKTMEYEPVFLSSDKGYGLKSYQQINGMDKSDELGTIETLWYYEDSKWIILQSKWKAAS